MDIRFEDIVNGTSLETIFKKRKESVDKANAKLNKKINKITFESEGEKELFREVNLKGFDDNNYICFFANKEDLFPNFNLFKETALKLLNINKELSKELAIVISKSFTSNDSDVDYIYSKHEMQQLLELNDLLRQNGFKDNLRFNEVYGGLFYVFENFNDIINQIWDIHQVLKANNEIDNIVNKIKQSNLSPYETMIFIHNYLTTNFKYQKYSDIKLHPDATQSIVGAFNFKTIVCAGFSSLTKAIIDKLNNPNLKCDLLGCAFYNKESKNLISGHTQCLINIKDEKYNKTGAYINDATQDCKNAKFPNGKGFSNFMFSVNDVLHYKDEIFVNEKSKYRFFNIVRLSKKSHIFKIGEKLENLKIKKYFKEGYVPDIVKMYGTNSNTIDFETFKQAYEYVEPLLENHLSIDEVMQYSKLIAETMFDNEAENIWISNEHKIDL